jgi:superfamily II DNA or RNA helicase
VESVSFQEHSGSRVGGINSEEFVYDLEVEDFHTYFAEGVGVSNCHGTAAKTQFDSVMTLDNTFYRFGLSGTPLKRGDGKNMHNVGALGRILDEVKTKDLVKEGYLANPIIELVPVVQGGDSTLDWQPDYRKFITKSAYRMQKLLEVILGNGEAPGLVFCTAPEHGEAIRKALTTAGLRCRFIWGDASDREREKAFADLEAGEFEYLIGSSVMDVGIDIPSVRFMLFAGGRKAEIAVIQRLGRGVRMDKKTGKVEVRVFDLFDLMDPSLPPNLQGNKNNAKHSQVRLRIYRREGWDVRVPA